MAEYTETTAAAFVTRLTTVVAGDIINLVAGTTYDTGSGFLLRNHGGTTPITIRSSLYASFKPGQRVCPGDLARMPLIRTTAANGSAFIGTTSAGYWTLIGLAITHTNDNVTTLLKFPEFVSNYDPTLESELCHHIMLDRCLIYGKTGALTASFPGVVRGVTFDTVDSHIIHCYISDFRSSTQDSQAIWAQQAKRLLIQNNYLEAAGENIMFGGSASTIQGFVTSDVTIRYNHLKKPNYWNVWHPEYATVAGAAYETTGPGTVSCTGTTCTTTSPHGFSTSTPYNSHIRLANGEQRRILTANTPNTSTFTIPTAFTVDPVASAYTKATSWVVKNLFEIKTGERVLIEGNFLEQSWPSGQDGRAVLLSTLNDNDRCPWHRTCDITYRENWHKNVPAWFYMSASDPLKDGGSNRTVVAPGPGTVTTVGTAATFSVPHGLAVDDIIRLTSGPQIQFCRLITVIVDATHATMRAGFRVAAAAGSAAADQTDQGWEKWTGLVVSQNAVVEHNVVEHMGSGEGGYYWNSVAAIVPSGQTFLPSTGLVAVGPKDMFFRHNTLSVSDPSVGAPFYLGETGDVIDHRVCQDNLTSYGDSNGPNSFGPFIASGKNGLNGQNTLDTFTINSSVTSNVFYGTGASATNNPVGNYWETNIANVGWDDRTAGRLELTSGPYRAGQANDASDGTDMGANVRRTRARVFGRHGLGQGW